MGLSGVNRNGPQFQWDARAVEIRVHGVIRGYLVVRHRQADERQS